MYSTISFISNIYYPLAFVFLSMGASLLTTSLLMICFWLSFACYIGEEMTKTMIMMMVILLLDCGGVSDLHGGAAGGPGALLPQRPRRLQPLP